MRSSFTIYPYSHIPYAVKMQLFHFAFLATTLSAFALADEDSLYATAATQCVPFGLVNATESNGEWFATIQLRCNWDGGAYGYLDVDANECLTNDKGYLRPSPKWVPTTYLPRSMKANNLDL
ncbi:hypothetical protein N7510_007712 [Penicillium lagena]|uniref:uncharacterized protein n=1 Tax=Penicillium lagena TaxID=94218 RepID=UPI00254027B6|nr:uncharacterized protein N7510_007712 [Penicillium lagena]KAJ5610993.1 hypothetical protein N7510_007712 [Penicillium lagena]